MNVLPLFESRAKSRSLSESNATNVDVHDHQTGEGERPVPCIERHHSSATYCLDFYAVVGVESGQLRRGPRVSEGSENSEEGPSKRYQGARGLESSRGGVVRRPSSVSAGHTSMWILLWASWLGKKSILQLASLAVISQRYHLPAWRPSSFVQQPGAPKAAGLAKGVAPREECLTCAVIT